MVFQLFNGHSSQIHVSWNIFNQYLTSPLSWHGRDSRSAIPIILSAKGESHYYQFSRLWSVAAWDQTQELPLIRVKRFHTQSYLTLYSIDTHFNPSTTDSFWKHCGKRRNCSQQAIFSFPTLFSTPSENCVAICQYFWHQSFICCWIGRAQNWHVR